MVRERERERELERERERERERGIKTRTILSIGNLSIELIYTQLIFYTYVIQDKVNGKREKSYRYIYK